MQSHSALQCMVKCITERLAISSHCITLAVSLSLSTIPHNLRQYTLVLNLHDNNAVAAGHSSS